MAEETEVLEQGEETPSVEAEGGTPEGETPEEYSLKHDGKDVKMSAEEFSQFYGDWENSKKWKATLNDKGRALNKERADLRAERKGLDGDKKLIDEYRELKQAFEGNPEAYKQINQLLNDRKPVLDPAIQEVRDELKETRSSIEYEKAIVELSKKYDDFAEIEPDLAAFIEDAYKGNTQKGYLETAYLAMKGSKLPELLSEARAGVVRDAKKKKGLPATGKKEGIPAPKYESIEEMIEAAHKSLESKGVPRT